MKIGILTYHRIVNEGSVLQAYCLSKYLRQHFPDDHIEIIDYRSWMVEKKEYRQAYTWKPPFVKNYDHRAKLHSLRAFLKTNCPISRKFIITDKIDKARRFIKNQNYDAIFVGSDTVWEVRKNGGAALAPNIYFLPNVTGPKKIAFAVSADQTDTKFLKDSKRCRALADMINDFEFKAIRDDFTFNFLKALGVSNKKINYLPDPTLLYNFAEIVSVSENLDTGGKPLAGVAVASTQIREQATRFFQSHGFAVINILGTNLPGQLHVPRHYSLNQRLGIFSQLTALVTDRFHGTIFTLKLSQAPVMFIEPHNKYPKQNSKGRDLLQKLNLEHMVFHVNDNGMESGEFEKYFLCKEQTSKDAILAGIHNLQVSATQHIENIKAILQ